jgi:hypothetical protein
MTRPPQAQTSSPDAPMPAVVACRADPERWFDRRNRAYALQRCLACPVRRQCAAEALVAEARFGMWAGIWIDDNLADVAHYLRALAAGPQPEPYRGDDREPPSTPLPPRSPAAPGPAGQLANHAGLDLRGLSPWVGVEVRSSGHCEVMMAGCRYSLDEIRCRVPDMPWRRAPDVSALYGVCARCSQAVSQLGGHGAAQLGYVVADGSPPQTAPFYWRQARWVLLDRAGYFAAADAAA